MEHTGGATPGDLPRWLGPVTWVGLAVTVLVGMAVHLSSVPVGLLAPAAVVALAAGWWLLVGDRGPILLRGLVALAAVVALGSGSASDVGWFAACLITWWCVLRGRRLEGYLAWAAVLVAVGLEALITRPDPGWGAWAGGVTFTAFAAIAVRHELDQVAALRAAQAQLAEQARTEERARIAREVHDIVAHSLTVALLHLSGARLAAGLDPAAAEKALIEAEDLTRDSLEQVRSAVGILRTGAGSSPASVPTKGVDRPLPTLADLSALVEQSAAAGVDVTLNLHGVLEDVPAATGLAVYRIAQEALTNAAKHAPGRPVTATLAVGGDTVDLVVDSAGPPGRGEGMGRVGMSERAAALGGDCESGPGGRGWVVHARLPAGPAVARRARR